VQLRVSQGRLTAREGVASVQLHASEATLTWQRELLVQAFRDFPLVYLAACQQLDLHFALLAGPSDVELLALEALPEAVAAAADSSAVAAGAAFVAMAAGALG